LDESSVYQQFCLLDRIDRICIPSKSVLHRYHQWGGVNVTELRKWGKKQNGS